MQGAPGDKSDLPGQAEGKMAWQRGLVSWSATGGRGASLPVRQSEGQADAGVGPEVRRHTSGGCR